jgi:TetR/AcrR family transcriptional regulator, transcriptional repressor for nem operon
VLQAAIGLFRSDGFHQVSVGKLVETTGLNRFALYEKFGGKEGLFYSTLDYYHQVVVKRELLGPLYEETASLEDAIRTLRVLQRMNRDPKIRPGCLIMNANIELGGKDERVSDSAEYVIGTFREAFASALEKASRRGELDTRRSVTELADYAGLMIQAFFSLAFISRESAGRLIDRVLDEASSWREDGRDQKADFQNASAGTAA